MLKIGPHAIDPPVLLAPMAAVSEMPFRVLALEHGAGLATTELISAKGIFYKNERTRQYLTYDRARERPYSVQLFGGELEPMAHAARAAMEHGADIIDINMGCPVKKVTRTGAGSTLLCDPPRAAALVKAMRAAVADQVPITAKIRTGWDASSINCVDMAKVLEDAGCAALAVHGRTRAQAYSGEADWDVIGEMVQAVAMPIIGNGDITSWTLAKKRLDDTGCAAVMIGRGALGNPWIFASCAAETELPPPSPEERCAMILRHLRAHVAFHEQLREGSAPSKRRTSTPEEQAVKTFRPHLIWYSRGLRGGVKFRGEVVHLGHVAEVEESVRRFFGDMPVEPLLDPADVATEDDGVDYRQAFG